MCLGWELPELPSKVKVNLVLLLGAKQSRPTTGWFPGTAGSIVGQGEESVIEDEA